MKQPVIAIYGSHNSNVSLSIDGKIKEVIEIERLVGKKNASLFFYPPTLVQDPKEVLSWIKDYFYKKYKIESYDYCYYDMVDLDVVKNVFNCVNYIETKHHVNHANSSLYQSNHKEALILSFDGGGNDGWFVLFHAKRGEEPKIIHWENVNYGVCYGMVGHYIDELKHEDSYLKGNLVYAGKLMGLAGYGKVRYDWLDEFDNWYQLPTGVDHEGLFKDLLNRIGVVLENNGLASKEDSRDLAATNQYCLERNVLKIINKYLNEYPDLPIHITGGGGLNILLNTRLSKYRETFVVPNPSDCGLSVGMICGHIKPEHPIDITYAGPCVFDHDNLSEYIDPYQTSKNIEDLLTDLLQGKIVGVVRKGCEHGPRALGNRSIICNPSIPEMKDILNAKVKHREWYRPFAPVVRLEDVNEYFDLTIESRWMNYCPLVKDEYKEKLKAITHIDGTARVQTVTREQNSWLYDLLTKFKEKTGIGVLLNTSFNVDGKPILNTYKDAFYVFENSEMDSLFLEDTYITKTKLKDKKEDNDCENLFTGIYKNFGFGGAESRSGPGSDSNQTDRVSKDLLKLIKEKNIKSVVDIPCGDFNWMKEICSEFENYIGGDIVKECIEENQKKFGNDKIKFIHFNALKDEIPECDLLIVRDLLIHFPLKDGNKIVENILKSNCKYILTSTWYNIKNPDNNPISRNKNIDMGRFYPVNLMIPPFNFPNPEEYIEEQIILDGHRIGDRKILGLWKLEDIKKTRSQIKEIPQEEVEVKSNLTVVTGLWDIGRPNRDFNQYIEQFEKLLETDCNMFIHIQSEYEHIIWKKRKRHNTYVKIYELEDIKSMYGSFWDKTQKIRTDPKWYNQTGENGWLKSSPQAELEWYNPIVMSKYSMLHNVTIWDPFESDYFLWIDAGITFTVYEKYFTENKVFDKMIPHLQSFLFLSYPYEAVDEIHGFDFKEINKFAGDKVSYVCRGGLFGGHKEVIRQGNSTYWHLVNDTLDRGLMGTEESIFTIMAYREPHIYRRYALDGNGLIVKYVQALMNDTAILEPVPEKTIKVLPTAVNVDKLKISVYMLTFNFPHQVEHTIQTWLKHPKWITNTRNILIDNSTNDEAREANREICKKYNFEHIITNENTGINGGRFRAAKHFQESDSDYYIFLEDDMGLHEPQDKFCRNGFRTYVPNLHDKVLKIIHGSDIDFLKLSYTEVYMDNNIQVSWYNVPQTTRTDYWPDYDKLPTSGLDPHCPRTKFNEIEVVDGLSYITGEIYYCNWPTICGKKGNQKMFLETMWDRPYEQTWMSYMFMETKKGNLKPAVLLASPVNHNRIAHYTPEERREN